MARGLVALGVDLDAAAQERLLRYLALLDKWNRIHNLTAIRDGSRMVSYHLLDSLAVLPHLPQRRGLRLADVGSGGGLPGIPLAVARPDWTVALLESSQKKVAFLQQAALELPLPNVTVVAARAESFAPARPFDVAIARAFADLSRFVAAAAHLLAPGGRLVAMKAGYPAAELERVAARIVAVPRLSVPGLAGERHLVVMEARA